MYAARLWLTRKLRDLSEYVRDAGGRLGDALYNVAGKIDPSPRPLTFPSLTALFIANELASIRVRRPARYNATKLQEETKG